MASSSPLPVEDQTDEDFFDRLVEDEFCVTESDEGSTKLDKPFFSTDIVDEGTQLEDLVNTRFAVVEEGEVEHTTMQAPPQLVKEGTEAMASVEFSDRFTVAGETESIIVKDQTSETEPNDTMGMKSELRSAELSGGAKSTAVKEVQWSAFSIDSQQCKFGEIESFSDFLPGNSDLSNNQVNMIGDLNSRFMDVSGHENDLVSSEQQDNNFYGTNNTQSSYANDPSYWENLYPGWKFDGGTGQWHQVHGNDATTNTQPDNYHASNAIVQESFRDHIEVDSGFTSGKELDVSYSQHTSSSMIGEVAEDCETSTVSSWNHYSPGDHGYPSNMVFDPQYPGWYFDTNTQEWFTLDTYTQSIQLTSNSVEVQAKGDLIACNGFNAGHSSSYDDGAPLKYDNMQDQGYQNMAHSWDTVTNNFAQHTIHQSDANAYINLQKLNSCDSKVQAVNCSSPQVGFNSWDTVQNSGYNNNNGPAVFKNFVTSESMHQFNQPEVPQSLQSHLSQASYVDENPVNYQQQQFHNSSYHHISYANNVGRSSAGRPPHALVTFGFGGKLVVMKDPNASSMNMGINKLESSEATVSVLNLMDVAKEQADVCDYFRSLTQQSFPGPLGGNAAKNDVYRWIEESIEHYESPFVDPKKGKNMKLLLSLLKISVQHYGKLRSPFGSGTLLEENDGPESAVSKIFSSAQTNGQNFTPSIMSIPSEAHVQATSIELENLLVSGKRKEALQCAQAGQLWGPALVLASQLGDEFYIDTVKQMAHHLFACGSPLRTLCLLIAGHPDHVFSANGSFFGTTNGYEQPFKSNSILDDWEKNLAVITAIRTKGDELVVLHLGDCLWKERGEVAAAHTCYLVAEANVEQYSDIARLCLIGADHWKYPRTYVSPDAIQRTEVYEYAKISANSQFFLLPFQPYKLIYASMLAEIGKISDSLRYCQASIKLLKSSSRTPEVEMWKSLLSSLEERLSCHQQGGFGENFASAKVFGKIFTSLDRGIHRIIGAPSSLPPVPQINANVKETQLITPKVINSQSTMVMSSLVPSASVEGMNEWTSDTGRKSLHSRSISEPDFGRTPKQDASNGASPGDAHNKTVPSRFGRIGSQFFQKTMGWVSRSRQARLGESNKFYYDEKLKRWVEEGAEPPAEQPSLQAPPKVASFQNGAVDYNIKNVLKNPNIPTDGGLETKSPIPYQNSALPPISSIPNQFSARRMGVRSRYVDTFNKGSSDAPANSFQSPSAPVVKPPAAAKFFVPASPSTINETATSPGTVLPFDSPSSPPLPPPPLPSTLESFPSTNTIDPYKNTDTTAALQNTTTSISHSRATSWGGNLDMNTAEFNKANRSSFKVGASSAFFPTNKLQSSSSLPDFNGGSGGGGTLAEELDEVELS